MLGLSEQNTIGHQLDQRLGSEAVAKTNFIADQGAWFTV